MKNVAFVIISCIVFLAVLMCSGCKSDKVSVEELDADPECAVVDCETACAICADERDDAIRTAQAWKELAEQCVHDKVKVKSR